MIYKHSLSNGLTIIIYPRHNVPKVAVQVWYGVGSKNEKGGQKGLAHLLEHMTFKGTRRMSEQDINAITGKLSAYSNAFTSQDYTAYIYNMPNNQWEVALDVLADVMVNCTFKPDLLNSELGAVFQELKLYQDDYDTVLEEALIAAIFAGHPYHYPIIGFKQDLATTTQESLLSFYKNHYKPNNATLVIVGDVDPKKALDSATSYFEHIPGVPHQSQTFSFAQDIRTATIQMHRDIQQPSTLLAFVVPGLSSQQNYYLDIMTWLIGKGRGSRLYKKLIEELSLVDDLAVYWRDMFEYGLFCIRYKPKKLQDNDKIIDIIKHEFASQAPFSDTELMRAMNQIAIDYYLVYESQQEIAEQIGKLYLATKNEMALQQYLVTDVAKVAKEVRHLFDTYFSPHVMHQAFLLPLTSERDKNYLYCLQEQADKADEKMLAEHVRTSDLEPASYSTTIGIKPPVAFIFPEHKTHTLNSGLKVLYYHTDQIPLITVAVDLLAKQQHDSQDLLGFSNLVMQTIIISGTRTYTSEQLAQELELYGMSIEAGPGCIVLTMLRKDLERGLMLLQEIVTASRLDDVCIEIARNKIMSLLRSYWDDPSQYIKQLARESIYGKHPYSRNPLGTLESVAKISKEHIVAFYQKMVTPVESYLTFVGDLSGYTITQLAEQYFSFWKGSALAPLNYPLIAQTQGEVIICPAARDQVAVCLTGLSVARMSQDYNPLLILDVILMGGPLGSMNSRFFALREQTGLFYGIGGSLVEGSSHQQGMIYLQTLVAADTVQEVIAAIKDVFAKATILTEQEILQAKQALYYTAVELSESQEGLAELFIFIERFGLPSNYITLWMKQAQSVSLEAVQNVAREFLQKQSLNTILVGRVEV